MTLKLRHRTCGLDVRHSSVDLLVAVIDELGNKEKLLSCLLVKFSKELAQAITAGDFYDTHVRQVGWTSEKEMCRAIDAATALLMRQLTDKI